VPLGAAFPALGFASSSVSMLWLSWLTMPPFVSADPSPVARWRELLTLRVQFALFREFPTAGLGGVHGPSADQQSQRGEVALAVRPGRLRTLGRVWVSSAGAVADLPDLGGPDTRSNSRMGALRASELASPERYYGQLSAAFSRVAKFRGGQRIDASTASVSHLEDRHSFSGAHELAGCHQARSIGANDQNMRQMQRGHHQGICRSSTAAAFRTARERCSMTRVGGIDAVTPLPG
jgi:hypothetical protein